MPLTPAQRKLRAQIAANTRWSREDPNPTAARGQAGLLARFEREVDPDGTLDPAERARRTEAARKAHMQRLALASAIQAEVDAYDQANHKAQAEINAHRDKQGSGRRAGTAAKGRE